MGATILDLIARGGSLASSAELEAQRARTAALQAQTAAVPSEIAQRQAVTAGEQQRQQLIQRQVRDEEIERQALTYLYSRGQPLTPENLGGELLRRGASAGAYHGFITRTIDMRGKLAKATQDEIDNAAKLHQQAGRIFQGWYELPEATPEQAQTKAAAWGPVAQQIQAIDPGIVGPKAPTADEGKLILARLDMTGELLKQALAKQQTATAAQAAATGAATQAHLEAQTAAINQKLKALQSMTGADWQTAIDSVIPDKESPVYARTVARVRLARQRGDLEEADAAIKEAALQLGRTETAVATARATAPTKIEVGRELAQARGEEKVTTLMVPDGKGGYTAQNFKAGESVPAGALTPSGASTMNIPTATTRTMAEKAPRVLHFVDRIAGLLDENEKSLGPLAGRWSEFTAGKIGLPNKGYTQIRTDVGLLVTALMNMHVGARGGQLMIEHFQGLLNQAIQHPENLRAALGEIKLYAQEVAKEGEKQPAGGVTRPPIVQRNSRTGEYRHSLDGGKTWQAGQPPTR